MSNGYENYTPEIPAEENGPKKTADQKSDVSGTRQNTSQSRSRAGRSRTRKEKQNSGSNSKITVEGSFLSKIKPWCTSNNLHLVLGIILGALGLWLTVAFTGYFTTCIKDQAVVNNAPIGMAPHIANPGGEGGARIAEFLINECFGLGSFVIILWLLALSARQLTGWPRFKPLNFTIKCILALICVSLIVGLLTLAAHTPVNWGGYHGRYVNQFVIDFLGWAGGVILCVMWIAIFVVVCMRDMIKWIIRKKNERAARRAAEAAERAEEERQRREIEAMRRREAEDLRAAGESVSHEERDNFPDDETVDFNQNKSVTESNRFVNPETQETADDLSTYSLPEEFEPEPVNIYSSENNSENGTQEREDEIKASTETVVSETESSESETDSRSSSENPVREDSQKNDDDNQNKESDNSDPQDGGDKKNDPQMIVNINSIELSDKNNGNKTSGVITYPYDFPHLEFLRPGVDKISVDASEQLENKEKIRKTLLDFGIPIVSIEATVGPTVTLYEIRPDTGVKIAKIRNLVDDIALSLAAVGVRIIAPIPGKGTVGIEVANKDPQTVSMRTVIQSRKFQESKAKLPIALGSTISNEVYVADLAKMPHLLVAGATGQGKSVGLNAIIASLLYSKRPEELKFVMIDPKRVEFALYSNIEAHYLAKIPDADEPIITDMKKVVATLSSLCVEMENRYDLLKSAQVRNIDEYNDKFKQGRLNSLEGHRFLPYIVVIIDEFSDLIMTAGKEVETPIARLAQMARAVGMHVIIATQRPSTNVITGVIKANFPVRIAFKVSSGVDSKTILDTTGAQQLIGRGDMLISMNSELVRVQCAFIDTPEVEKICQYVMEQPYGKGAYILPEPLAGEDGMSENSDGFGGATFGDRDPLFTECARYVVMARTASASSLQRRYSIGYNRAGKIRDQMEALGIVGPTTGGKARDVLIDSVTLEAMLAANGN